MERCPRCGDTIADNADYCPACGHVLRAATCERHPDRPAVGVCVVCERTLCRECDHPDGGVHRCETHADIPLIEGWAQVYTTGDEIQADLIRDNLRSEGVEARVFSQKDRSFAVALGDLSPVRVIVPAYAYEEAMEIIRAHTDSEGDVAFACPACGEAVEPGTARCPTCGAAIGS